ncbi:MAG: HDOD domain-containing protein [Myxococcaceae bacterium]
MVAAAPQAFNHRLADAIRRVVLSKLEADTLQLPTLPPIAVKCTQMLRDENVSMKTIAALLEQDPMLAVRVIRMAASPMYAVAGGKPLNLLDSLVRLGRESVKTALIEASAQKMFLSRDQRILESTRWLWRHSGVVGQLSRDISTFVQSPDADFAALAGLLHDIGKPVVATILLEAEREVSDLRNKKWIESPEWMWVISQCHRDVGVALAKKWELPALLVRTVRDCYQYDFNDRTAVCNAVCFANALAEANGHTQDPDEIEDAQILLPSGQKLLGFDDDTVKKLVASMSQLTGLYD